MKKKLITFMFLAGYSTFIKTILVTGDPYASTNNTFSFNVGFLKFDPQTDSSFPRFWSATNDSTISGMNDATKQYGLSIINQATPAVSADYQSVAIPMTNSEAADIYELKESVVNFTVEANPIWGNYFKLFDVIMQKPIFVVNGQESKLYSVQNIERYLTTSDKPNVTELTRYDFGSGTINAILGFLDSIYAAHSTTGDFGTGDSTISLIEKKQAPDPQGKAQPCLNLLAFAPLTTSSEVLIGGVGQVSLASFGPQISLNTISRRVYFATQAQAGSGGIAVPMGQILLSNINKTFSLAFAPVAPESVLQSTTSFDTVISAADADGQTIRITKTAGMSTSTGLSYMLIARDSGTGPETIYALPLMTVGDHTGMIADYTSVTTNYGSLKPVFTGRYFTNVISDASQIRLSNTAIQNQIKVGGASTLPISSGTIQQLYSLGDSVYAVIGNSYTANDAPGTYRSQAIFASDGHIIGWSPWTRVLGSDKPMKYSFIDYKSLTGLYLATTTASPDFKSIYQTTFTNSSSLAPFLENATSYSGIQGLFDFNQKTPGFNNAISLMIGTAFQKVTFGQTGGLDGGFFKALSMTDSDVLVFDKTSLENHTSLVAAEIAHDNNNNHYIFAGGASGLSVYVNSSTGVSWNGNLSSISDLNTGQSWKTINNFKFVKKLAWDGNYIYIMTSDAIYRIALNPNNFINGGSSLNLDVELFINATQIDENAHFLDMIIDNGYCLLGTTQGLYRFSGTLQKIDIPGGLPAVSQLTPISISTDINPQRSFKTLSNLYVLNNTFGTQQAKIYRFVIENEILNLLPDSVIAIPGSTKIGKPGPFIIFNNYISSYFTDGSWNTAQSYFLGLNQDQNNNDDIYDEETTKNSLYPPFVLQVNSTVHSGQSSSQVIMPNLTAQISLPFIKLGGLGGNILNMIRETTSGALIASGEFQAHANA